MTKKIYYEKKGRRYVPVSEYDSDFIDAFSKGTHLVMVYPGGSSRRYNIDPNYAALIAAGRVAEDAISSALMQATEIRLPREIRDKPKPMTPEQIQAWENLVKAFGDEAKRLEWASIRECAEAGVQAMQEEADKLMSNPSVRKAYERFLLICELTKEHTSE